MNAGAELLLLASFLIIGLIILIGIPPSILWWLNRWFRNRNRHRMAVASQLLLGSYGLLVLCTTYFIFFPPSSYFEGEFEEATQLKLPSSAQLIIGADSNSDFHGDYSVAASFRIDSADYDRLLQSTTINSEFAPLKSASDPTILGSAQFFKVTKDIHTTDYYRVYSAGEANKNAYRFVGFLKDHQTIVFHRSSS